MVLERLVSTLMICNSKWGCLENNLHRGSDGVDQQHVLDRMRQCAWSCAPYAPAGNTCR